MVRWGRHQEEGASYTIYSMPYTVKQLANLAGVSVRTLHYYDEAGLLKPARVEGNGYRQYGDTELLSLQQILFFRELDFPLEEIRRIMASPYFDMAAALRDQRKLIELKKKRLSGLIETIDKTLRKLKKEITMEDKELYGTLSKEEMGAYAAEAKQRWGHTDAWRQSQERTAKFTAQDWADMKKSVDVFMQALVRDMGKGATSPEMQARIAEHYNSLRTFYEPNLEMYRGLAEMYIADPRFTAFYEKYAVGLAEVVHDAMIYYVDVQEGKK